jgi:FixJ family two-component response regulator
MTQQASGHVIAVVDDDASVLRSLECLLESADYEVRLFASGAELLNDSCLAEIDCLLSDFDLPGMNGFELVRQVHAARPGLPVIYITAYREALERLSTLGEGKLRLFAKPFRGSELLAAIGDALRPSS